MLRKIELKTRLNATPGKVYDAWLDGKKHSKMTGTVATGSARKGGTYTAWDGYITGKNLELVPGEKIVQSWRSTDFKKSDPDSLLEIRLKAIKTGCELTLIHSKVPDNQEDYETGWKDYYFKPMKKYFSK